MADSPSNPASLDPASKAYVPRTKGGPAWRPTEEDIVAFKSAGFIIVENFLSDDETQRLTRDCEREDGVRQYAFEKNDGAHLKSKMALWNIPGDDLTGQCGKSARVAEPMDCFLGGKVYMYHTKLIMKEAKTGGRFAPHQDRGYWMNNGMLRPHAATVMISLDRADAENGCLQVWPKSHRCGVLPHSLVGEQTGADVAHVEALARDYVKVDVVLNPGDACFFHCDLMHVSQQNTSDRRRWCFLVSFNRMDNNPVWTHHHPLSYDMPRTGDDAFSTVPEGLEVDPLKKDFMVPVTSIKDGQSVDVTEQWQARGASGKSGGVQMGTTAAAARKAMEGGEAGSGSGSGAQESKSGEAASGGGGE